MSLAGKKIALDCGMDPSDSVLIAYLPKLDMVVQELYRSEATLHVVDGVVIDMTGPKAVRWWQVRAACTAAKMPLLAYVYCGKARDFSLDEIDKSLSYDGDSTKYQHNGRLHMRAYSHGPWICLEPEQLEKVYASD